MTTTTTNGPTVRERVAALPPHKRDRVDREAAMALAYVWGWEDAHGANTYEVPQGFSDARREAVLDYVTERRTMLPSIADHFREWAGLA